MNEQESKKRFSNGFLLLWIFIPAVGFFLSQFVLREGNSFLVMHWSALFLALFVLPVELRRFSELSQNRVLLLLLFLAPFYLAAGRLQVLSWRGGILFLLLGVWLGIGYLCWRWGIKNNKQTTRSYLFLTALLSFGIPFVVYLFRDFGGKNIAALLAFSPFSFSRQIAEGQNFETGGIFTVLIFTVFFLSVRGLKPAVEEE